MIKDLQPGMSLISLTKTPNQRHIDLYAQMSGDFNPIHIDPTFAKKSQFKGTIAHGMLLIGYISEMMLTSFGQSWLETGWFSTRFRAPAPSGKRVIIDGEINKIELSDEYQTINCDVFCKDKLGNLIIKGKAGLIIRN